MTTCLIVKMEVNSFLMTLYKDFECKQTLKKGCQLIYEGGNGNGMNKSSTAKINKHHN